MTFAPKKAIAAAVLSFATIATATTATTTTANANELVAGTIGFVAGTLLGSAATSAHQSRVVYHQPVVVHGSPAAWTPAWYASCSQRYRSFNPHTGYWLHVSGEYRFCH